MSTRRYYGHQLDHGFTNATGQWQVIDEARRNWVASALNDSIPKVAKHFAAVCVGRPVAVKFPDDQLGQVVEVVWQGQRQRMLSHELAYDGRRLLVPVNGPTGLSGRWQLWLGDTLLHDTLLRIAPATAYPPPRQKLWGPAVQLYSLRRQHDWGIGDFTALSELVAVLAPYRPGFIGLNPLHALPLVAPERASPYSPGDRGWLNIWYIDPLAAPCAEVLTTWLQRPDTQARLAHVQHLEYIDYSGVARLKWQAFVRLFRACRQSKNWQQVTRWCAAQGEALEQYAQHEAITLTPSGQPSQRLVMLIKFCQWLAWHQLRSVHACCEAQAMPIGLYIDLAVGCVGFGAEGQRRDQHLVDSLDMGAPPDPFGPSGQVWGMPITHPAALAASQGEDFTSLMAANMCLGGALRIDHAMGLMRIWAVPSGSPASDGAYVSYDLDSHVALLNQVSVDHQCVVVAEDLGTVPDYLREVFPAQQYLSMQVLLFERDGARLPQAERIKQQSLAVLSSHDMPPLASFWQGDDIQLRQQIGQLESGQAEQLTAQREEARQALANTVDYYPKHWDGEMLYRLHAYLAASPAQWVSLQLEDLLMETRPVNIPGTQESQYPNWRRRLTSTVSDLLQTTVSQRVLAEMRQHRSS